MTHLRYSGFPGGVARSATPSAVGTVLPLLVIDSVPAWFLRNADVK